MKQKQMLNHLPLEVKTAIIMSIISQDTKIQKHHEKHEVPRGFCAKRTNPSPAARIPKNFNTVDTERKRNVVFIEIYQIL